MSMKELYKELEGKEKTIRKLQLQLAEHQREVARLKRDRKPLLERLRKAESDINPVRESLNTMTAERGKWMRKMRKLGIKV